jgi:hypothetical protein
MSSCCHFLPPGFYTIILNLKDNLVTLLDLPLLLLNLEQVQPDVDEWGSGIYLRVFLICLISIPLYKQYITVIYAEFATESFHPAHASTSYTTNDY